MKERVVITGLGCISPVGNDVKTAWQNIMQGQSGIQAIEGFDVTNYTTRFAGQIRDFNAAEWMPPKEIRKVDPFIHYAIAASIQAVKDAGLDAFESAPERVGVAISAGIGGIGTIGEQGIVLENRGPRKVSPQFVPATIVNMAAGHVSQLYNFRWFHCDDAFLTK